MTKVRNFSKKDMTFKQFLAILPLLFPAWLSAQFYSDFVDYGEHLDTVWHGTRDKFRVQIIDAASNRLELNDAASATGKNTAYLSRRSQAVLDAEWQISFTFGMELTGSNYARYYVVADTFNLCAPLNGYFVWIGNSGKEIALYRQNGTQTTKIIDGQDGRTAGRTNIDIKLTRDSAGTWKLYSRTNGESDFTAEGSCNDRTNLNARHTGFVFCYSKTNGCGKYFCNDISATGKPYIKPEQNIGKYDIVFSEIMADPEPQNQLPLHEYLEIYNRSDSTIDLTEWTLVVNGKASKITEGSLEPHAYAIVCAANAAPEFAHYGTTLTATPWQQITNAGTTITLYDDRKRLIAWVDFTDKWYGNANFKKDGGWSLERCNNDYLDNHADNWKPSEHTDGGTPGQPNSVADECADERMPRLIAAAATTDTVTLRFSKTMDETLLTDKSHYEGIDIADITAEQPQARCVRLALARPLNTDDSHTLTLNGLHCVDGMPLDETDVPIALPQKPDIGDIVLNEILFNPKDDGVDFVELLNLSDKTINLEQLLVTRRKNGELDTRAIICNEPQLFAPHAYLVLTSDPEKVCAQYDCPAQGRFATVKLPSMPDDEGNIVIVLPDGTVLDELNYTAKMHHAFVSNPDGVSLERVNPNVPTQTADNWQSASFEAGYATPARQNSQYIEPVDNDSRQNFWTEYDTFTPDNDGFRDLLPIGYLLPHDGYAATIDIYTATGTRVRRLRNGQLTGAEGTLYWDGRNDSDALCSVGVYVIFVEAIHPEGAKIQQKIVCVLSAR